MDQMDGDLLNADQLQVKGTVHRDPKLMGVESRSLARGVGLGVGGSSRLHQLVEGECFTLCQSAVNRIDAAEAQRAAVNDYFQRLAA